MTPPTATSSTAKAKTIQASQAVAPPEAPLTQHDDDLDIAWPPSNLYSDEPPLETTLHLQQMILLLSCLNWLWKDRDDYFASGNLTVYYSPQKRKDRDFRGPDFFVALDTHPHPRKSWTVWEEEGKYPNVIVELLSESTAAVDRGLKKDLYAKTFRTPEYFWFDPESQEFQGFALVRGSYQPIDPTPEGWLWSQQLQLFLGIHKEQLRYFTPDKILVPTSDEAAATESQRADTAQKRADKLAEKLRELGIDPSDIT